MVSFSYFLKKGSFYIRYALQHHHIAIFVTLARIIPHSGKSFIRPRPPIKMTRRTKRGTALDALLSERGRMVSLVTFRLDLWTKGMRRKKTNCVAATQQMGKYKIKRRGTPHVFSYLYLNKGINIYHIYRFLWSLSDNLAIFCFQGQCHEIFSVWVFHLTSSSGFIQHKDILGEYRFLSHGLTFTRQSIRILITHKETNPRGQNLLTMSLYLG